MKATRSEGATPNSAEISLETLLDAPVLAGRHAARLSLTIGGVGPVSLDLVAERRSAPVVPALRIAELRELITQMRAVFGSVPCLRYDILARLSDNGSSG